MSHNPHEVLHSVFGFDAFVGLQAEIIDHVIAGSDALVLMPTGGGKSLCYQIPALCRPGMGVVVSPLIALMRDQVEALKQLGVRAARYLSSIPVGPRAPRRLTLERVVRPAGAENVIWRRTHYTQTKCRLDIRTGCSDPGRDAQRTARLSEL